MQVLEPAAHERVHDAAQKLGLGLEHGRLAAELDRGRGRFEADEAAADDDEARAGLEIGLERQRVLDGAEIGRAHV